MAGHALISVVAGVLYDDRGRVLIAQRPPGSHMEGAWEFPGGKLHTRESPLQGLRRELREELGVEVIRARPLIHIEHAYDDRCVVLDVWQVHEFRGTPSGLDNQALRWVEPASLAHQGVLPADAPIITALNLPPRGLQIGTTGDLGPAAVTTVTERIRSGCRLVVLDAGLLPCAAEENLESLVRLWQGQGAEVLFHGEPGVAFELCGRMAADGVCIDVEQSHDLPARPDGAGTWLGLVCRGLQASGQTITGRADFVILTDDAGGHGPESAPGWPEGYRDFVRHSRVPVYLLATGIGPGIEAVWSLGGQGLIERIV